MKSLLSHIAVLSLSAIIFSGCYTQIKIVEIPDRPTSHNGSDYDEGYHDGYDTALYDFRDFNRARWSGSIGYMYSPASYHHRSMHFHYSNSFFYRGYYPMYSHFDFIYDPWYYSYGGYHYHRYPFMGFYRHHWYGYQGPIIIYNNYYAQAKPRPAPTLRGSGVNRGTLAGSNVGSDPQRAVTNRPASRTGGMIGSSPNVNRGASRTAPSVSTRPASRGSSSGTVRQPARNTGSSGTTGSRPTTRQGSNNSGGSSGNVNRGNSSGGGRSSSNRPRSRNNNDDQAMLMQIEIPASAAITATLIA